MTARDAYVYNGSGWDFIGYAIAATSSNSTNWSICTYVAGTDAYSSASWTDISLNTEESDVHAWHSGTDAYITPNVAGVYLVTYSLEWASDATGARGARVVKNSGSVIQQTYLVASGSAAWAGGGATLLSLNGTTDTVKIQGYQSSGGNLALNSARLAVMHLGT